MSEYKRVVVTAEDFPQVRLAEEFMSLDSNSMFPSGGEKTTLVAIPHEVRSYIETTGKDEGWAQYVESTEEEPIDDPSELPDHIRNVVEEVEFRVWKYAMELIDEGDSLNDYFFQGRVRFTCTESTIDAKNAEPASIGQIRTWLADNELEFDDELHGVPKPSDVFNWSDKLSAEFPGAELYGIGEFMGPSQFEPHGSAFLDGVAVTMLDDDELPQEVIDAARDCISSEIRKTSRHLDFDEFGTFERDGKTWLRVWWD